MNVRKSLQGSLLPGAVAAVMVLGLCSRPVFAKDATITAIELYEGTSGPAYIQLQNVSINGKIELRNCTSSALSPIDKSTYNKLDKVTLSLGGTLERGADGVLRYSSPGAPPICVVPENLKFDKNTPLAPAALAEGIAFHADAVAPGSDGAATAPVLKNGVKLVFVAVPNEELAEFLLAQRESNIAGWDKYLAKFSSSQHADEAKDTLASLHIKAGQQALSDAHSAPAGSPQAFQALKQAKVQMDAAHALRPDSKPCAELAAGIVQSLQSLVEKGRAELDAYNIALAGQTPGYVHLETASTLAEGVTGVDAQFKPGASLRNDVQQARNALDSAFHSADEAASANQPDDAVKFIQPYRAFAGENPRIAKYIDSAYQFHLDAGKQAVTGQDWQTAVTEFEKASTAKDTPEARDALKDAKQKLLYAQDEAAAKRALERSQQFEAQKDFLSAYESLSGLTPAQAEHLNVKDEMTRLTPQYMQAAAEKAKQTAKEIPSINGTDDEKRVERAVALLRSIQALSEDSKANASYSTQTENLVEELNTWFLSQAKHFIDRPAGSFTEVGWAYLLEADQYKAANPEAVIDAKTSAGPAHAMHSKLSIRVHLVDQTSLREGTGFMHQMENAIITELQKPIYRANPIRYGETTSTVEPDYQLEGSVLEHEITTTPSSVSKPSHYRANTMQVHNDEWTKASHAYEDAHDQVQADEAELAGATKLNNKKRISELSDKLTADSKAAATAKAKRDSLPEYDTKDDIHPYQYTQKTIAISNKIKIQFTIARALSSQPGEATEVERSDPQTVVQTKDVKPDDTDRVQTNETEPNLQEMQDALGNKVREDLIAAVGKKVLDLPRTVFADALALEKDDHSEAAAEAYLRYLSVVSPAETADRLHAEQFLRERFNFTTYPSATP